MENNEKINEIYDEKNLKKNKVRIDVITLIYDFNKTKNIKITQE